MIKAKDDELPALYEKIEVANKKLAKWLSADAVPMQALVDGLEGNLADINDRIFHISLYAGLTEQVVQCAKGKPTAMQEKLHAMQRRLYMDEECLLGYRQGGMAFSDIREFDAWLCEADNRERILPFPRTLVAMQVRRYSKEREADGTLSTAFIHLELE